MVSEGVVTEVLLVRHGETAWNREGRLQGQNDPPLNALGEQQAQGVADYLRSVSGGDAAAAAAAGGAAIAAVYTSDLQRAAATAVVISQRLGLGGGVQREAAFREKKLGVMEGLTLAEAKEKEPDAYDRWRRGKGCPGAEDPSAVLRRVAGGLDEIERAHRGKRVVVVTHGGILNSVHKLLTGVKFPGKIPNTSISTITKAGAGEADWQIQSYASSDHLVAQQIEFDNKAFGGRGDTG